MEEITTHGVSSARWEAGEGGEPGAPIPSSLSPTNYSETEFLRTAHLEKTTSQAEPPAEPPAVSPCPALHRAWLPFPPCLAPLSPTLSAHSLPLPNKEPFLASPPQTLFYFLVFILVLRERAHRQGRGRERRVQRIQSRLHADSRRARRGAGTHKPRDRDLSRSQCLPD